MAKKKTKKKTKKRTVKKSAKKRSRKKKSKMALAIVALILNVIILPGLGSLIANRIKEGVWQLVLAIVGIALSTMIVGIPILVVAWIWAIVTGVQLIQDAQ